jgi:hypothetical protein
MAERAIARAETGGGFDRAQHELAAQSDGVLERLAVAEQCRNRGR